MDRRSGRLIALYGSRGVLIQNVRTVLTTEIQLTFDSFLDQSSIYFDDGGRRVFLVGLPSDMLDNRPGKRLALDQ